MEMAHSIARPAPVHTTRPSLKILLVEDDRPLAGGIASALEGDGHVLTAVFDGTSAIDQIGRSTFDLMILDIELPGLNGYEVLRHVRATGVGFPVLFLTARDAVEDRVLGLESGADDYMIKPFALLELLARVRALVRRHPTNHGSRLVRGPLVLDQQARRAYLNEVPLELAAREWSVLEILMKRIDTVVSKAEIIQAVTGDKEELSPNAIEVYMSRLRTKVEPAGIRIRTVRGFGYMLEETSGG
jgi:two-component system, OmpR family, response regulator